MNEMVGSHAHQFLILSILHYRASNKLDMSPQENEDNLHTNKVGSESDMTHCGCVKNVLINGGLSLAVSIISFSRYTFLVLPCN